jgi:hypothetical protein
LFLKGWRAYTVTGNEYTAYLVEDPGGAHQITELLSWKATTTGWDEFSIISKIIPDGVRFRLALVITEPDPVPTTWTGNWDYTTPNNPGIPTSGVILHANQLASSLRVHKTDNDGGDRSADLAGILPGDIIEGPGGLRWSVQAVTDQGVYVDFSVAPAQQAAPDGVAMFTFETVTATSVTTVVDSDYYAGDPQVSAGYKIDDGAEVSTQDAYGIDVKFQEAYVSPDWEVVVLSG